MGEDGLSCSGNLNCCLDQRCRNVLAERVDGHWPVVGHANNKELISIVRENFQVNAIEGDIARLLIFHGLVFGYQRSHAESLSDYEFGHIPPRK